MFLHNYVTLDHVSAAAFVITALLSYYQICLLRPQLMANPSSFPAAELSRQSHRQPSYNTAQRLSNPHQLMIPLRLPAQFTF